MSVTSRRSLRFLSCRHWLVSEVSFSYIRFFAVHPVRFHHDPFLFTLASRFTCGWILWFSYVGRLSGFVVRKLVGVSIPRRHIIVDLTIGCLFLWRQNDGMTGCGNFFRISDLEQWIYAFFLNKKKYVF